MAEGRKVKDATPAEKKAIVDSATKATEAVYREFNRVLEPSLKALAAGIGVITDFYGVASVTELLSKWAGMLDMEPEILGEQGIDEIIDRLAAAGHPVPAGKEQQQALEVLKQIEPTHHRIAIHKVMDEMIRSGLVTDGQIQPVIVARPKGKKTIETDISLVMAWESDEVKTPERFTLDDRTVHDAVCSLFDAGNTIFTPKMVYNQMMGNDLGKHVRPETEDKIIQSLRKCQMMLLTIDYTREVAFKRLRDVAGASIEQNILPMRAITVTNRKGAKQTAYEMVPEFPPPLYEYAKITNQIISIPQHIHKRERALKMSDHAQIIQHYLYRRIEVMRKNKNGKQQDTILIKTMMDACQLQGGRVQQKRWRDMAEKLLDSMQESGFIGDYKVIKGPKNITEKYQILLDERDGE